MTQKNKLTKNENELRRLAGIAVRQLKYRSLRDYELAMYREAIAKAEKMTPTSPRGAE